MTRYLERAENTARLLDVGFRMALTRGSDAAGEEWRSVLVTIGQDLTYRERYGDYVGPQVFNWILRDRDNPSNVLAMIESARTSARSVRTSITREVWEATNDCWMQIREALSRPVREGTIGAVLDLVRGQTTQVRGAMDGTMLRNEVYNFARIGTFIERADNTARILDVKYYVLLPSPSWVGSSLDNVQWETVLRSVAGNRAYRWLHGGAIDPRGIARFLILDGRFPRSLVFCYDKIRSNMAGLASQYAKQTLAHELLRSEGARLHGSTIESIFEHGLHEFLERFIVGTVAIGNRIAADYRFVG